MAEEREEREERGGFWSELYFSRLSQADKERILAMTPAEFRGMVRRGEWTTITKDVCPGYAMANLSIVPQDLAFEYLRFCNLNPHPLPVLEVTRPGEPRTKILAKDADLRTDLPRYRVFRNGELTDEPTDITGYWQDDLVCFLTGCSLTFAHAFQEANISWRRYGEYLTNIQCVSTEHLRGHIIVGIRGFYSVHDALRAIQISSRFPRAHGGPVHFGRASDMPEIGILNFLETLGKPDPLSPIRSPDTEPPKPGEIIISWGAGTTAQSVAQESKIPFMITHCNGHMFITDIRVEEMASL
jgi:uncharacterized protein YcsI (UPF0317 family)